MRLRIRGVVQGVGFRPAVVRVAREMGLNGHVRNDGAGVEIVVDGDYEAFVERLRSDLPPLARIDSVERSHGEPENRGFVILESGGGQRSAELPPDTAVCPECLREMADRADRRFGYPFTTCTACGERFSVVRDLPYDRVRTAMDRFNPCPSCRSEYGDAGDRRFHHQTVACPECGPRYALFDADGKALPGGFPEFAAMLDAGKFGVLKGWGGAHICALASTVQRFREWYGREAKPLAIMMRNADAVRSMFQMSTDELRELGSPARPILLLKKMVSDNRALDWLENLAPGLDTVGVMLPYSGAHYTLFSYLKADALIMTSANRPGAPMCLDNREMLGLGADCYLLHDRDIANRCDDSVVKMYGSSRFFIRRSRGFVPSSLRLSSRLVSSLVADNAAAAPGAVLGVGPGENVTTCIAKDGLLTPSQYIGDVSDYDVAEFHRSAIESLSRLRGVERFGAVGVDMHPRYATRRAGEEIAARDGARLVEVQHHWAHALSLMAECGLERAVVLTLDGTGYGDDGEAWGGEVLVCDADGYRRVGHLEYIPLPGGDAAVRDTRRFLFAISEALGRESDLFDGVETEILRKSLRTAPKTSSAGRVLDAISYQLGACSKWTYDGEPAMRLEPLLERGRPNYEFETVIEGGAVRTLPLFERLMEMRPVSPSERCNAVSSFVLAMVRGLVQVASEAADSEGLDVIGLSGGVAYSLPIVKMFEDEVLRAGKRPLLHDRLPPGDGGISAGQCVAALSALE